MALPIKYTPLPSPAVATINYIDLAEGITIFNACTSENPGGVANDSLILTTGTPYSHLISLSGSISSLAAFSGSFDSGTLNRPLLLKGDAFVNMTWRVTNSSSSNQNYPFASLRKWDGTTETELVFVSGSIINSQSGTMFTTMMQFPTMAATLIKAGEQIRLNVGVWAVDAGNSPRAHIACDPQNRDNDWFTANNYDTTKLMLGLPTKIQ